MSGPRSETLPSLVAGTFPAVCCNHVARAHPIREYGDMLRLQFNESMPVSSCGSSVQVNESGCDQA